MRKPLYTTEILRLASQTAGYERLKTPQGTSEKRSPICGSRIIVDICLDTDGRVADIGQEVRACALGQASAALMAQQVRGKSAQDISTARDALRLWLAGEASMPAIWPGLDLFEPALPHKARHPAILLAFEAAAEAAEMAAR
jgi:NifU-like protein involved in Fe-S cluster formation